jgi:hypothetical protein
MKKPPVSAPKKSAYRQGTRALCGTITYQGIMTLSVTSLLLSFTMTAYTPLGLS